MHLLISAYLPERETDLAYAGVVEQYGIVAGAVVALAAAVLVWRLAAAARHARNRPAGLVAGGFAALFGVEVMISIAANLGLLPTAGVPLPLVSYGGTAAAVHIGAIGLVLGLRHDAVTHQLWMVPNSRRLHPRLLRLAAIGVAAALVAMLGFAWNLQQRQGESLRAAGLTQMTRCVAIPAPRGLITDRHGTALVSASRQNRVWLVPALTRARQRVRLAALTGRPVADINRLADARHAPLMVDVGVVPPHVAQPDRARAARRRADRSGHHPRLPVRRRAGARPRLGRHRDGAGHEAVAGPAARSDRRPRRAGAAVRLAAAWCRRQAVCVRGPGRRACADGAPGEPGPRPRRAPLARPAAATAVDATRSRPRCTRAARRPTWAARSS